MAESQRDNGTVDAVLQQVHRRGVTQHVRRHTFLLQQGACCLCHRQMRAVHALRSRPVRLPPTVALGRCSPIWRLRRGLPRQGLARGADPALAPEHLPLGFALRHSQIRFQPRATLAGHRRRLRPLSARRYATACTLPPAARCPARPRWLPIQPSQPLLAVCGSKPSPQQDLCGPSRCHCGPPGRAREPTPQASGKNRLHADSPPLAPHLLQTPPDRSARTPQTRLKLSLAPAGRPHRTSPCQPQRTVPS